MKATSEMRDAIRRALPTVPGDMRDYGLQGALDAAPVPPAGVICDEVAPISEKAWRSIEVPSAGGEVEVLGYWCVPKGYPLQGRYIEARHQPEGGLSKSFLEVFEVTELVDRAHVTHLTAENARLQEGVDCVRQVLEATRIARDAEQYANEELRSELTKARKYIKSLRGVAHTKGGITLDADIDHFLAHQSAPAAKEGE